MVGVPHSGAKAPEDVRRGGLRDSPAAGVWLPANEADGGPKLVRCYRISAMLATNSPILPRSPTQRVAAPTGRPELPFRDLRGPGRARDGCTDWTLSALCRWIEDRFDKRLHPASLSRIVRRLAPVRGSRPDRRTRRPTSEPRPPSSKGAFAGRRGRGRGSSRRNPRCLLRGVECAHPGAHPITHRIPLDRKDHFIGAAA